MENLVIAIFVANKGFFLLLELNRTTYEGTGIYSV